MNIEQKIKKSFEANLLDGDKAQPGQMIASTEIVDWLVESVIPILESYGRAERVDGRNWVENNLIKYYDGSSIWWLEYDHKRRFWTKAPLEKEHTNDK